MDLPRSLAAAAGISPSDHSDHGAAFKAQFPEAGAEWLSPGRLAGVSDEGRQDPVALLVYYNRGWTGKKASKRPLTPPQEAAASDTPDR